jgi:hypothetical protein
MKRLLILGRLRIPLSALQKNILIFKAYYIGLAKNFSLEPVKSEE